jgi:hypothetical protein
MACNELHAGQGILHPVVQFVNEQVAALLRHLIIKSGKSLRGTGLTSSDFRIGGVNGPLHGYAERQRLTLNEPS